MDMYNIHEIKDTILQGDTLKQLRLLPDNSIDMVITSPPYWKLRDYGVKGQLGQEEDFRDYLKKLRYIFKEVYRVLKPTGSCYVNIGDTFAKKNVNNVKKKSLVGIPDRFKVDMIDMGFICRGEIVWCLEEDTKIFIRINNKYSFISIKDLYYKFNEKDVFELMTKDKEGNYIWVKIKNLFNNGQQNSIKITTKTGKEIVCSEEHEFPCRRKVLNPNKNHKFNIKKAKELTLNDKLYSNDYIPQNNFSLGSIEDYEKGYIIGFYLAEGNMRKYDYKEYKDNIYSEMAQKRWGNIERGIKNIGVMLSCGQKDISRGYLKIPLKMGFNMYEYNNEVHLRTHDKNIVKLIEEYVQGDVCDKKQLTDNTFNESLEFLKGILMGFLHGDGHYDKKNTRWRVGIKPNNILMEQIRLICRILHYDFRLCNPDREVKITGHDKIYHAMNFTIRIDNQYRLMNNNCTADNIDKIEHIGFRNMYDIEVETIYSDKYKNDSNYNNLYFLANGIWTHNCKPNQLPSSAKDRFNIDYEKMYFFTKTEYYYFETQYEPMLSEIPKKVNSNKTKKSKYKDTYMEKSVRQGLSSDRGNNLIEKRNLLKQEDFVKKLRKNFKVNDIIEKTGLKKTLVEHWFRKDLGGFAYPKKEDWEKVVQAYEGFNPFPELLEVYYETDDVYKNADKGRIKRSVWSIPTKALKEEHYAPFPEELVEIPIKACCPEGGIVLDIFMGSGTSGLVAKKLEKFYLGIELNPQFITLAYNRIYK